MTLVSVVIPVHNRRAFIEQTVQSVLAQTYADVEVIVVDDGSTDGSADVVEQVFGDRVRILRLPTNEGRSTARNKGWALARGALVAFLDSDDLWAPEKLARQVPHFEDDAVAIVHCRVAKIDVAGRFLEKESGELAREFLAAEQRGYDYGGITQTWCRMYTSAAVVRRDALRISGGFDPSLSNFEDYDVLWRIARDGRVVIVPEVLAWHRKHSGNTVPHWKADAEPWLYVNHKHLAELPAAWRDSASLAGLGTTCSSTCRWANIGAGTGGRRAGGCGARCVPILEPLRNSGVLRVGRAAVACISSGLCRHFSPAAVWY